MANPLYVLRPDQDVMRSASFSATSEQETYEAANAGTDNLDEPWWADSTSGTLTANFSSASIGAIFIHNPNFDHGITVTIGGDITGSPTVTGARNASGSPKDLVYIVDPPQTLTSITIAATNASNRLSIGRLAAGPLTSIGRNYHVGAYVPSIQRMQFSDENAFGHDIRYDLGVERWQVQGDMRLLRTTDLATLEALWSATRGGFYPVSVRFDSNYPVIFARMQPVLAREYIAPLIARVSPVFVEVSKGLEVVG